MDFLKCSCYLEMVETIFHKAEAMKKTLSIDFSFSPIANKPHT